MIRDAALAAAARGQAIEPPQAQGREQHALVGDAGLEHVVERADAVARHDQHPLGSSVGRKVGRHVEIAYLARVDVAPAGQGEGGGHPPIIPRPG